MEDQKMTQQEFADFLQQSPATLSSIFNGRTRPTLNVVDAIKLKIPDISIEWLLYGVGQMYVTRSEASSNPQPAQPVASVEPTLDFGNFEPPSPPKPQPASLVQSPAPPSTYPQSVRNTRSNAVVDEVKIINKSPRRVTEIRVYYDDQTYESFVPAKK